MKSLFILIVGIVIGLFLWANIWFKFTQDLSIQAVENAFDGSLSDINLTWSSSSTKELADKFNKQLKERIELEKAALWEKVKDGVSVYLKEKVDKMLGRSSEFTGGTSIDVDSE